MEFWQFLLFLICWFSIEYLCIHLEVKHNKELFYILHINEIIRELKKYDKE